MGYVRDGDTVRVASMDRLARSLGDIVDEITTKGASVEFVKEQQTYSRDTDDQITEARRLVGTGVPKTTVARGLNIDRATLYRMLAAPRTPAATDA
ncbi:helix-turn-helix domain-containing protein, partial [Curtobacterium sp. VKM Ac-2887]|uniref:helix-turn-helix domain-containing protein n=1 Tax=Curtobacterium sp. VKM Ac-2887 TaxID=2783819 RepID=UPI002B2698DB